MEKITYYTNSGEFEAEKLLPCPFCGGEPEFRTIGNEATKNRKAEIECTKCHVRRTTGAIRNNLEWCGRKAIELWNARWQETSHESAALPLHGVSVSESDIKKMFPYEDIEEARPTRPLERIMKYNARQEDRREGARILLARIHSR